MSKVQSIRLIAGLIVVAVMTVAAAGAAPQPIPIQAHGNSLSVSPMPGFTHGMFTVRMRGVGVVYKQGFEPQAGFSYGLLTNGGTLLGDGRYVFEVWVAGSAGGTQKLSGSFEILGGSVSTETLEVDVKQDIIDVTILGDAIVEGSLCVSDSTDCIFDLIIFESENFDTPGFGAADIKVKDNVPEIWFADTTAEDGDFALTVEDSKFFLRDPDADTLPLTVESGAPSDSVYVAESGFVGINTAVPQAQLHVVGPGPFGITGAIQGGTLQIQRGDTTPNIRFLKTQGTAQSWLFQNNTNSGNFAIRDETAGVSSVIMKPGGVAETLVLADGRWGLQVFNPAHPIDTNTGARLTVGGVWQDASSRELKTSIQALNAETAFATLAELAPVTFEYKAQPNEAHVGFIAEDVPDLVASADRKGLSAMDIVAVLTRVVQDLEERVERQERQILEQQSRLDALLSAE